VARRNFGRYKIAEEIGRGAMGVVYRALDPLMGRTVAIKAINTAYLEGVGVRPAEYLQRFRREAEAAGALSHPHIVKIFDLGPDYLVMEYVEGQSLASLLQARIRLGPARILEVVAQVADALDHAHARGIVHRDVKPGNVMLRLDGAAKVMDFGVARVESSTLTAAGEILGSVAYMAPEVILGRPADARSDLFSLGVVAYELMTGERPFAGGSITAIIQNVVREDPRPARQLNAALPPEYDACFERVLAKDPALRHPSATAFAAELALRRWVDEEPARAAPPGPTASLQQRQGMPAVPAPARVAPGRSEPGRDPSATIPPWPPAFPPSILQAPQPPESSPTVALEPTLTDVDEVRTAALRSATPSQAPGPDAPAARPQAAATRPAAVRRRSALPLGLLLGAAVALGFGCLAGAGLLAYRWLAAAAPAAPPATLASERAPTAREAAAPAPVGPAATPDPTAGAPKLVEAAPPPAPATTPPPAAPSLGTLAITSDPPGARVTIGKRERGVTPLTLQLRPGRINVILTREGYRPHVADVTLRQRAELNARLLPEPIAPTPSAPTPPPPLREGDLVPLGPDVAPPRKLAGESPRTPAAARNLKLAGSVLLEFVVDEQGRVQDPRVLETAGGLLDTACLEAVRTWRYQPATKDGVKVRVLQRARFTFQLR
jgi:TonB family protein